nr:flagellar protein FliT [Sedimenticola hydrogenitrophicus]
MLSLARQGEWEQLTERQVERQRMIEQAFPLDLGVMAAGATAAGAGAADEAARQIRVILDLDKQLMQLAQAQQQEIGKILGKMNQGRVATRAYQDTSRG